MGLARVGNQTARLVARTAYALNAWTRGSEAKSFYAAVVNLFTENHLCRGFRNVPNKKVAVFTHAAELKRRGGEWSQAQVG